MGLINILSTEGFPPRWFCGSAWTPLLGWTHIISDLAIFLSYTAIPVALIYLIKGRKDIFFTPLLWLFAGFILFCGLSHLIEATIFWYPWYNLSGLIKLITAIISIITAAIMITKLPLLLNLPSIIQKKEELEKLIASRDKAEKFFEDFYENAPDMFASVDNNRKIIKRNRKLLEVTGYSLNEIIGMDVRDLYHPDCNESVKESVEFFLEHGYIENAELIFKTKLGGRVAVILNVTSVKDDQDKVLYRRAVWRDVRNLVEATYQIKTINHELLFQKQQFEAISNRLNAVLNSVADGVMTISIEGIIESFNKAAENIFGYKATEIIGQHPEVLKYSKYTPEEKENYTQYLEKIAKDGRDVQKEVECIKKDGTVFYAELSLNHAVIDGQTKFICSIRDISARKQIEIELKKANDHIKRINVNLLEQNLQYEFISRRLNAVLNGTADGIITINSDAIIESFNHAAEVMYQRKAEEVIGKNTAILNPPKHFNPNTMPATLKTLVTDINQSKYETCIRKDGTIFPVEFSLTEVIIDDELKFIGSVRDISERKRIEDELASAYQKTLFQKQQLESVTKRLSAVLNSTADGIITISSQGVIESFNHAAELIFGYESSEILGLKSHILSGPQDLASMDESDYDNYLRSFSTRIKGVNNESICVKKDGTLFPVEYSLNEIEIEGETKFISSVRDISKRKEIELKLMSAYNELEEFVYIASHDLKEPLRGIHNYATFLIEDYENIIDQEGKDKLYTLKFLTTRLDKFIDDLLYYSRVGKTELSIREINLNELVKDVIESLKITIKEKKITLKLHELPTIICDQTRVAEVFRNLITNAMKYNDKEQKWIDIGCNLVENINSKPTYVFYVKDNGIGIPDKYFDVIFKIFKRLHGRDKFGGGSGAGLTIVKKIINQHGGKIWVESVNKEGTTFYFTLQEDIKEDEGTLITHN